eukprot:1097068-Rhodomonas_salina.2
MGGVPEFSAVRERGSYMEEEDVSSMLELNRAAQARDQSYSRSRSALVLSAACLCAAVLCVSLSGSDGGNAVGSWASRAPPTFLELSESKAKIRAAEKSLADKLYAAEAKEEKVNGGLDLWLSLLKAMSGK